MYLMPPGPPHWHYVIKKSVRAVLVARPPVRGFGMCPSQLNEQTCRDLTQNVIYTHTQRSLVELD